VITPVPSEEIDTSTEVTWSHAKLTHMCSSIQRALSTRIALTRIHRMVSEPPSLPASLPVGHTMPAGHTVPASWPRWPLWSLQDLLDGPACRYARSGTDSAAGKYGHEPRCGMPEAARPQNTLWNFMDKACAEYSAAAASIDEWKTANGRVGHEHSFSTLSIAPRQSRVR
jgi:hypothetical protein